MVVDKKWFQDRIRDLGLSQRRVSTLFATNPNTLSLILADDPDKARKVQHDELPIIADALQVSVDELLRRLGVALPTMDKDVPVEVIGTLDETGRVSELAARRTVDAPAGTTPNTRAVIFNALGAGHVQHGWVYFVDVPAKPRPVDADTLNALCLVEVGDHPGYHVGVVRRGIERGTYDLFNAFTGQPIVSGVAIRSAVRVNWIKTA